jgi:hypothetical protein
MQQNLKATILGSMIFFVVAGCGGQKEALKFTEAITNSNKKLESAGVAFGNMLNINMQRKPLGVNAQLDAAYDDIVKILESVKQEFNAVKVPDRPSGKALFDVYQKFLQGQEQAVKGDFKEILDTMRNKSESEVARLTKVQQILTRVDHREKIDLPVLQNAHRAFAKEYNIILK